MGDARIRFGYGLARVKKTVYAGSQGSCLFTPLHAEKDMVTGVRIEIVGLRMLWLGTGVDYSCI